MPVIPPSNEVCSLCNQCDDIKEDLKKTLINIADKRLYNIRYELNRPVDYPLYMLYKFYKRAVSDICKGETCHFFYGQNLESILERAKIITS